MDNCLLFDLSIDARPLPSPSSLCATSAFPNLSPPDCLIYTTIHIWSLLLSADQTKSASSTTAFSRWSCSGKVCLINPVLRERDPEASAAQGAVTSADCERECATTTAHFSTLHEDAAQLRFKSEPRR
jgi:hypothetical protein